MSEHGDHESADAETAADAAAGGLNPGAPDVDWPDESDRHDEFDPLAITLNEPWLAVPVGRHAEPDAVMVAGPARRPPNRRVRRDARVGPPPRSPQWMLNQLPIGMLESEFFTRFVGIFQELGSTLLDGADNLEFIPDVSVTPSQLLPYLASWIGASTVDASSDEQVQRLLVRSSAHALAWRGTKTGIADYLRMLSGGPVEVTDSGGVWPERQAPHGPSWVRMRVQQTGHLSENEFITLVLDEVPAHVRAELWIGDRRVWASTDINERERPR